MYCICGNLIGTTKDSTWANTHNDGEKKNTLNMGQVLKKKKQVQVFKTKP